MITSRSIWIVTDYGGEYEDGWEYVIRAFSCEKDARDCAKKRMDRQSYDPYDDYCGSDVQEITLVDKEES